MPGAVTGLRFTGQVAASEWLSDNETNLVEVIHHAIGERLVDTTVALDAAERFGRYFTACDHLEHYRQLCDAATAWVSGVPNDPPAARDRARRRLGTAGGPHRKVPGL